jgi:hypothetical protein
LATDLANITRILFGNTDITEVRKSDGTIIWPATATYTLKNLNVSYSSSNNYITPDCSTYAWLTATLVATRGSSSTESSVILVPNAVQNDLYVISYSNSLQQYIITANPNKKTTEYSNQSTLFTGTYTIGGTTYNVTSGTTSKSVALLGNTKTTTPASETTTAVYAYLTNQEFNYSTDVGIDASDGYVTVTCTQYYNLTHEKYTYTSGAVVGGDTSTGLSRTGAVPTSVRVDPSTGATVSGNTITFGNNQSLNPRYFYVYATIGGIESQNTCQVEQGGNYYMYGSVSVAIEYDLIDASGGTVYPNVVYSQSRGFAPNTSGQGYVSTGGSITYYVNNSYSATGAVSANSLGTTPTSEETVVATNCYATVSMNGKTGTSEKVSVYQDINEVTGVTSIIKLLIGNQEVTSYSAAAFGLDTNNVQHVHLDASTMRTYTYTSTAQRNEQVLTSSLSSSESLSWVDVNKIYSGNTAYFDVSIGQNTSDSSRSGNITISDSSLASKTLSITQSAAQYVFEIVGDSSVEILNDTTAFDLYVRSTRNGEAYSFTKSRVSISYPSYSNRIVSLSCSSVTATSDPTVFKVSFTCNANTSLTTDHVSNVTITQRTGSNALRVNYTITQKQYVEGTITTNVDYVEGSNSFRLTTNKAWSINTTYAMCDYQGNSKGTSSTALTLSQTSGDSAATNLQITVTRNSAAQTYFVDIEIICGLTAKHVICTPYYTMANVDTSWTPGAAAQSTVILNTNYPVITWDSSNNWLTGSGNSISVTANTGSSNRSSYIVGTGSVSGTYFGVSYTKSATSSRISVTQTFDMVDIYILGPLSSPEELVCSTEGQFGYDTYAPAAIKVTNITIQYSGLYYRGTATFNQGDMYARINWDVTPHGIDYVVSSGNVAWDNDAPAGYQLGSNTVYWLNS